VAIFVISPFGYDPEVLVRLFDRQVIPSNTCL
jgi:hypothetical protein